MGIPTTSLIYPLHSSVNCRVSDPAFFDRKMGEIPFETWYKGLCQFFLVVFKLVTFNVSKDNES